MALPYGKGPEEKGQKASRILTTWSKQDHGQCLLGRRHHFQLNLLNICDI